MSKTIPSQDLRNARLAADPTCSKCGITKTVADFPRRAVDYWCNKCRSRYAISFYHRKRAKLSREDLATLKAKVNRRHNEWRAERIASMSPSQRERYRTKVNDENKKRRVAVRDVVYKAYGGYKCACCGETERHFLSIDHINNDGAVHRRKYRLKTGEQLHRWIVRNGFPSDFQVLCMNCQWGKRNNKGVCPHQVRCNDHPARE